MAMSYPRDKMKTNKFDGVAECGLPIFWYANGVKEERTIPQVAFIQQGWSQGVADISVIPAQSGAVQFLMGVYHISDPRTRDPITGGPSGAAKYKGMWEFTPMSLMYLAGKSDDSVSQVKKTK
jgi:hypothetical protein